MSKGHHVLIMAQDGTKHSMSVASLLALISMGHHELSNELEGLDWEPEERHSAEGLQAEAVSLMDFLSPPWPDDELPF